MRSHPLSLNSTNGSAPLPPRLSRLVNFAGGVACAFPPSPIERSRLFRCPPHSRDPPDPPAVFGGLWGGRGSLPLGVLKLPDPPVCPQHPRECHSCPTGPAGLGGGSAPETPQKMCRTPPGHCSESSQGGPPISAGIGAGVFQLPPNTPELALRVGGDPPKSGGSAGASPGHPKNGGDPPQGTPNPGGILPRTRTPFVFVFVFFFRGD